MYEFFCRQITDYCRVILISAGFVNAARLLVEIVTRRVTKAGDPLFSTHRVGVAENDLLQLDRAVRVIEPANGIGFRSFNDFKL
jgi:hypothetical protein